MDHLSVSHPRCIVTRAELLRFPDVPVLRIPDHGFLATTIESLVLEENDGVVVFVRGKQGIEGILGSARVERLDSRHREEEGLKLLRMKRTQRETAAAGKPQNQGTRRAGPKVKSRGIERDLRDRFGRKIRKLKLLDRTMTVEGESDRIAGARAF